MASVRSLASQVDDAVSVLGGDDDYRREMLLFVLLHTDPRDPVGEAIRNDIVGKLFAGTDYGLEALAAYKKRSVTTFDQKQAPRPIPAQSSA